MKFLISTLTLLFISGFNTLQAQDEIVLARQPAINPDGSVVTFSYQGDIWTVPFAGGEARRLTVHEAYESAPRWSPDGESIAFSGGRYGNDDIFVIPATGGQSKRITYYSGGDDLWDWTSAGRLLFTSNRTFQQVEWDSETQHVSAEGGTPTRFMNAVGDMPAMSPNGRYVAFVRGSCRISREGYNGPADLEIWIHDTEEETYIQLTDNSVNDFLPRWKDDQTLYFISARSGRYNIYEQKMNDDGTASGDAVSKTNFKEDGVRYFDVADNGNIVFEQKTALHTLARGSDKSEQLDITLSSDYRFYPQEHKTYTDNISGYEISSDDNYTAMTIRGEIFVRKNDKENQKSVNLSDHPYRDRSAGWLNDSTVVFTSDRDGQYDLYLARSSDENKPDIFKSLKHELIRVTDTGEDEINPVISPDGNKIAFQ